MFRIELDVLSDVLRRHHRHIIKLLYAYGRHYWHYLLLALYQQECSTAQLNFCRLHEQYGKNGFSVHLINYLCDIACAVSRKLWHSVENSGSLSCNEERFDSIIWNWKNTEENIILNTLVSEIQTLKVLNKNLFVYWQTYSQQRYRCLIITSRLYPHWPDTKKS